MKFKAKLKKEFKVDKNWFYYLSLIVDLGYFWIKKIKIEHIICGIKKHKIILEKSKIKDIHFYNRVLGICSALLNFCLEK